MYVVEIVLLTCAGGLGLVLFLPLVVEARMSLPPGGGGFGLRIDAALLGGLLGCRVNLTSARSLRLLVAGFPLPFVNLTLGGRAPSEPEADPKPSTTDAEAPAEEDETEPDEEKEVESRDLSAVIAQVWKYVPAGLLQKSGEFQDQGHLQEALDLTQEYQGIIEEVLGPE